MKKLFLLFCFMLISIQLFANTSFIINKVDIETKHNKQFSGIITITNYTYMKEINYEIFASYDGNDWIKLNDSGILKQEKKTEINIRADLKKELKIKKKNYSDFIYYKVDLHQLKTVDYICNISHKNLNICLRTGGDINERIPPIKTKNTVVINKSLLEKMVDIFPSDEIRLNNLDEDHIKQSVEFKVYCNKKDKWIYLGYLNAAEDSIDDFEFDDNLIDFVNATYIALVPVIYMETGIISDGYFFGNFHYSQSKNYTYTYVTPYGVIDYSIDDDDFIINFRAATDEDGSLLIDDI